MSTVIISEYMFLYYTIFEINNKKIITQPITINSSDSIPNLTFALTFEILYICSNLYFSKFILFHADDDLNMPISNAQMRLLSHPFVRCNSPSHHFS